MGADGDGDGGVSRVRTEDGVEIVATYEGQGPPLVLLPAGPGTSATSWRHVEPMLRDRFTCHRLDTRGRGASSDHPDHSPARLVEDVTTYLDGLDEPCGLVGWGTALWALVAAEAPASVAAVAAYEPGANEVMSDEVATVVGEVMAGAGALVGQGRLEDAVGLFLERSPVIYAEEELAAGAPGEFWAESAGNLAVFLQELAAEAAEADGPTAPATLSRVSASVLLLGGTRSRPWFQDSLRHVADHLPAASVRAIEGATHFGPYLAPRAVADAMVEFFSAHLPPG